MQCPKCSAVDTRVIDSRVGKNGRTIRRRRQCTECNYRFNTIEEIIRESLLVIKRDGRREEFDRNKILNGIRRACEKRPIDAEQINMLISDVTLEIESEGEFEISGRNIGDRVMEKLKNIDQIAYVRFASVYKDFRDISEMAKEISELEKTHENPS